jgi:hypothetical protein
MSHAVPFTKHEEIFASSLSRREDISIRNTMEALECIHAHAVELFSESEIVNILNGQTDDGRVFTGQLFVSSLVVPSADQFDAGALLVCVGNTTVNSQKQSIVVYVTQGTELICYS